MMMGKGMVDTITPHKTKYIAIDWTFHMKTRDVASFGEVCLYSLVPGFGF
jgi:hypothetical protein